ncbi:helix-turn-helix domain-containing protein [Streptomyces kaempferi]|uniref:Helix-turn-helix domain-containing protein n=1 Tax=Streptomyces kaempferi TaxID=333725 RepID=A0ABW3XK99_9ACTN
MSVEHMAMVFAANDLDGSEKLLLLAYTNYTDPHGYCWPGEDRLADDTGTSLSTVRRTKKKLIARNLLRSMRRNETSNMARVNLPLLASMARPRKVYDDNEVERLSFSSTESEPVETGPDLPTGQSDLSGKDASDLQIVHSDLSDRSNCSVRQVNLTGPSGQSDLQSISDPSVDPVVIHQSSDGRRPSTGSRELGAGGSAASGKTKPSFSRERRGQYDAFVKALPAPLAALVPRGLPDALVRAVLAAVDLGSPEGRTVEQLVEYRLMPKWDRYYSSRDQAGPIEKPVGVLVAMLRRDAECGDARCDERTNVDTGQACSACEMRTVDRRADRDRNAATDSSSPSAGPTRMVIPTQVASLPGRAHCACGNPFFPSADVNDDRCKECREGAHSPAPGRPNEGYAHGAAAARSGMVDKAARPRR